jgi:hypothetical protein
VASPQVAACGDVQACLRRVRIQKDSNTRVTTFAIYNVTVSNDVLKVRFSSRFYDTWALALRGHSLQAPAIFHRGRGGMRDTSHIIHTISDTCGCNVSHPPEFLPEVVDNSWISTVLYY